MENKDWCDQDCARCSQYVFSNCSDRKYDLTDDELGYELNIEESDED